MSISPEPSICNYIFTNPCFEKSAYVLIGIGMGALITLSATHPDRFLEIMKYPISESIDFPLSATVGIVILGSVFLCVCTYGIKKFVNCNNSFKDNFLNYKSYDHGSSALAYVPPDPSEIRNQQEVSFHAASPSETSNMDHSPTKEDSRRSSGSNPKDKEEDKDSDKDSDHEDPFKEDRIPTEGLSNPI